VSSRHRRRSEIVIEPFKRGQVNKSPEFLDLLRAHGLSEDQIKAHLTQTVAINDRFTVLIKPFVNDIGQRMIWLSIKKNDRRVIDDWRELQTIKNMIVGPEVTAVQVFPPEKHLVDTSNQYHLWCYVDANFELPFGYKYREVQEQSNPALNTVQRPLRVNAEIGVKPFIEEVQ